MISKIPTGALILGLSGVIPFGWGAVTLVSEEAFNFGIENFGARFVGPLYNSLTVLSSSVSCLAFFGASPQKWTKRMRAWAIYYLSFQHYGHSSQWAEGQLVTQLV